MQVYTWKTKLQMKVKGPQWLDQQPEEAKSLRIKNERNASAKSLAGFNFLSVPIK